MGGVRNGATEEDWHWDLKPRCGSHAGRLGPCSLGKSQDHMALGCCSLLPRGLGSRRDLSGKERGERILLFSHEKVAHGFGLTGDRGDDTADGAGTDGLPEPRTSTSFPETRYPGLGRGRGKDCASVGILKDFSIFNEDISHYSKSV